MRPVQIVIFISFMGYGFVFDQKKQALFVQTHILYLQN